MDYKDQALISGVGRRKCSYAKVYFLKGSENLIINKKSCEDFFYKNQFLIDLTYEPLKLTKNLGQFAIIGFVHGGGCTGQAEALRLAISKALSKLDPKLRKVLKQQKFLHTDSRVVERKKYGLKKARKASQYSKR